MKTLSRLSLIGLCAGLCTLGGLSGVPSTAEAAPPPGMPDPSRMSGIPRPDPNLSPGTVTVRCLDGSFANPAIGVEVELEITGEDGGKTTRTATTVEQGRATFSGLEDAFGETVVAKATVAGQTLKSQPFVLGPQAGVALMLVASGASGPPAGPGPGGGPHGSGAGDPHGGQGAMPVPGEPFPLAGRPPGMIIVGALDLGREAEGEGEPARKIGPIPEVEITLRATAPGVADPIILTGTTDSEGRVTFEGLDERLPANASIVVEAQLEDEGDPTRSKSFTLGDTGYAIVLTRGAMPQAPARPQQQAQAQPTRRMQLPGPRVDEAMEAGAVRVFVIDAHDQPVADQQVVIHTSQVTGDDANRVGRTNEGGMAIVEGVPFGPEMLSQLRVIYDGAPYSSTFFNMPEDKGAVVMLRVFEVTTDRSKVRSALQIDVSPRENDFAAVTFMYAAFVEGDEAFWVPGGMRLYGPEDTRSMHVLPEAESWLFHDGEAPWVDIDRPLPPGEELRLSFAVGLPHDGELELEWSAPFPLVEGASRVTVSPDLSVTHGVAGAPQLNPHAGPGGDDVELYELGHDRFEPRVCDYLAAGGHPCPTGTWGGADLKIVVEDLPVRSRLWPWTAWGLLGLAGLGLGLGLLLRPRVDARAALLERRDALMAELVSLDERGEDKPATRRERARLLRTLDRIYRQLEALGSARPGDAGDGG